MKKLGIQSEWTVIYTLIKSIVRKLHRETLPLVISRSWAREGIFSSHKNIKVARKKKHINHDISFGEFS